MEELTCIFKALSDQTRLRILKLLQDGELCVCDIFSALDMVQPKVSFHLAVLKEAGLIKDSKAGRWIHYRLDDSDLFKRSLLLSVLERIQGDLIIEDKKRLDDFKRKKIRTIASNQALESTPDDICSAILEEEVK